MLRVLRIYGFDFGNEVVDLLLREGRRNPRSHKVCGRMESVWLLSALMLMGLHSGYLQDAFIQNVSQ